MLRLLDCISDEMRWRKVEQALLKDRNDIVNLLKRQEQRPMEFLGKLPNPANAFEGASPPVVPPEARRILEGILDGDLAQSTGDGATETTAVLSVWEGLGAAWTDTGENITVINRSDTFSAKAGEYLQVRETESGEFRPIFFPSPLRLAKTDAAHAKSASGTVSIYTGAAGAETDTLDDATAFNKFAALATTKWVVIARIDGDEYLIAGEC